MIVSRRQALAGALVGVGATAAPAIGMMAADPVLAVYDSRIPESAHFAKMLRSMTVIDIGRGDHHWRVLRDTPLAVGGVIGLTGWSDWVATRGVLQERGLRMAAEDTVAAPLSGRAHLFRWNMIRPREVSVG